MRVRKDIPIKTRWKIVMASVAAMAVIMSLPGCNDTTGSSEISKVLLGLLVALVAAKLGGERFVRMGQPSVLGELVLGIVACNLTIFGFGGL